MDPDLSDADAAGTGVDDSGALPFPVVGVGASAGGLEAFTQLLRALPVDTGMAFVLVQHLAPTRASMLADILGRATSMPVMEVRDEPAVAANHVYIIPPDREMIISGGRLKLFPRSAGGAHHPVDSFFGSLATHQGHTAIGVVLSGTASDGTAGLEEIKAAGGITFAQDATAQQGGMPESAIASGCVDLVLPPDEIAQELDRIARHPYVAPSSASGGEAQKKDSEGNLSTILKLLRDAARVDFSQYKANTLSRRIERRMVLHKVETLRDYARFVRNTPGEVEALYQEILIGVTGFFRDPDAFEAVKGTFFAPLLEDRSRQDPVRIWVLGCSTGEEAYSLAMAFAECEEVAGRQVPLQIFASDLNAAYIEKARAGIYPRSIASDVSPERLERFFVETDGAYRVRKPIRDVCLFTPHNALVDPPFSRLDLVSCRNLLIYLEPVLQQQILLLVHYALKPGGILMLGSSETIGSSRELFEPRDAAHKLYARKAGTPRLGMRFPHSQSGIRREERLGVRAGVARLAEDDVLKEAERFLLGRYAPPSVVVNAELEIVHVRGDVGAYLAPAVGRASLNLSKMARPEVLIPLRAALRDASETQSVVREHGVRLPSNGGVREITLEVAPIPIAAAESRGFVIAFVERGTAPAPVRATSTPEGDGEREALVAEIERSARELASTREYLQSVIEQQEATNEALQSSHEEIQSANEELQSINEELETSKEEIQSSNEELCTVNDELQTRNTELGKLTDDLSNLIASIEISVIIVTRELRVRRFSPMAAQTLALSVRALGSPISNIPFAIEIPDLERLLNDVIDSGVSMERDVRDRRGHWYSLRIRPYRTVENKIDGAVLILVDVDTLRRAREYAESIVDTVRTPLVVLDRAFRVVSANSAFYETFHVAPVETARHSFYELGAGQWDVPELRKLLEDVLPAHGILEDFEVAREFPSIGDRVMLLNARPVSRSDSGEERILVAIEDITDRRMLEYGLRTSVATLNDADRHKNEFLAMLAHELRNPLAPIRNASRLLQLGPNLDDRTRVATEMIERQVNHMVQLVDDLLDVSRITLGTIVLRREQVDLASIVNQAVEAVEELCERTAQKLRVSLPPDTICLNADPTRVTQIISNLLVNACKFSPSAGHVDLIVDRAGTEAVIRVRDAGIGMSADDLPRIFDIFMQVDTSRTRSPGGLGIGLTLVKRLVELHGGSVRANSRGVGQGSEFIVRLPIATAPDAKPAPKANRGGEPTGGRRVLVVDDNRDAAESLGMLLESHGHEVALAHDGAAAVKMTLGYQPDVVVLDLGLPGIDGHEVARQIRATTRGRGVRLIALTGWGRDEDRQRSAAAGFDAHMVKPVDYEELTDLIRASPSPSRDPAPA